MLVEISGMRSYAFEAKLDGQVVEATDIEIRLSTQEDRGQVIVRYAERDAQGNIVLIGGKPVMKAKPIPFRDLEIRDGVIRFKGA